MSTLIAVSLFVAFIGHRLWKRSLHPRFMIEYRNPHERWRFD